MPMATEHQGEESDYLFTRHPLNAPRRVGATGDLEDRAQKSSGVEPDGQARDAGFEAHSFEMV